MESTNVKCINCRTTNKINLQNKIFVCIKCGETINSELAYKKTVEAIINFGKDIDDKAKVILKKYNL